MSEQESLKFKISLSGTYWAKRPQCSIWLDEHCAIQTEVTDKIHIFEFERTVDAGLHALKIRLDNKDKSDTVLVNNEITQDLLLNIHDIEIEEISLGPLIWDATYILDQPQLYHGNTITQLDRCVNLGWNGTYLLNFNSPFYLWLLEKL